MLNLKSKFKVKTEIKLSYNFDHLVFKDLWRETVLIHSSTSRRQGRCGKNKSHTPSCRISSSGQRVRWGTCRATTQIRRTKPHKQSQLVHLFFGFLFCFLFNMVKLSAELIEQAAQYTNPVRDRELDLRGWFVFPPPSLCRQLAPLLCRPTKKCAFPLH